MGKRVFGKFFSGYVWGNILAILIFIALLCFGVRFGMDYYTHHGESIVVPNLVHKQLDDAKATAESLGLTVEVIDTGFIKTLPPNCILEQTPVDGKRIKSTHIIYVVINASSALSLPLPDLVDNCSLREAQSRLLSMGFTLGDPVYRAGEKDWIYEITVNGRPVKTGDMIPKDAKLVMHCGNGMRDYVDNPNGEEPQEPEFYESPDSKEEEVDDGRLPGEPPAPPGYRYETQWVEVPITEHSEAVGEHEAEAEAPTESVPTE